MMCLVRHHDVETKKMHVHATAPETVKRCDKVGMRESEDKLATLSF